MKKLLLLLCLNLTSPIAPVAPTQTVARKILRAPTKTTVKNFATTYIATSLGCGAQGWENRNSYQSGRDAFIQGLAFPTYIAINLIAYPPYLAYKKLTSSETNLKNQ